MSDGRILTTRDVPNGPQVTTSGAIRSVSYESKENEPVFLKGRDKDGTGAIGHVLDCDTLADASAKLVSYRNGGVEKAYLRADGSMVQAVTWDDVVGSARMAGGASALVQEAFLDTGWQCLFFKHNADETISFDYQFPHRWNRGEVRFHAHIIPAADPASNEVVKLSGRYAWAKYGVALPAFSGWTAFDVAHTVKPGDIGKPTIVSLFSSTPEAAQESDFLLVTLTRLGQTDAADTYSTAKGSVTTPANLALLGADVHYQVEKLGTVTEYPGA